MGELVCLPVLVDALRTGMTSSSAHLLMDVRMSRPSSGNHSSGREKGPTELTNLLPTATGSEAGLAPDPGGRNDLRQARTLAATTLEVPIASRGRRTPQAHRSVLAGAVARQVPSKYARIGSK